MVEFTVKDLQEFVKESCKYIDKIKGLFKDINPEIVKHACRSLVGHQSLWFGKLEEKKEKEAWM